MRTDLRSGNGKVLSQLLVGTVLLFVALAVTMHVWVEPVYAADSDGDGLSDAFEIAMGMDPYNSDGDQDNLDDFTECYVTGTDPSNPDTDMDGQQDDVDPDPLVNGSPGGSTNIGAFSYTQGGVHLAEMLAANS